MASAATIEPTSTAIEAEIPTLPVYRFRVDQYLAMVKAGVLDEDDRVELIEGWIVPKIGKYPPHAATTLALYLALIRLVPAGWFVAKEDPIVLANGVPEPDLSVVRGLSNDFGERHPNADEVAMVVEVADSSSARDRREKLGMYARSGISTYWIVNLIDSSIEVHSGPKGAAGYDRITTHPFDEPLPVVLDGVEVGRVVLRDLLA